MKQTQPHSLRRWALPACAALVLFLSGCPRNQTTLDDRPLEKRPHIETDHPIDKTDPFRP